MMRILPRHNVNFGMEELEALLRAGAPGGDASAVPCFEQDFARYHGARHAVATGSGRAALYLALRWLELPPGAAVALPAYAFYTLPAVVASLGLEPIFVPCDPHTYAIDPEQLGSHLPDRVKALVVLHPFGQTAPMAPLEDICARRRIALIEDPSQSIGARYRGRAVGTFGRAAAFSLVSGKNMTACGGGMLLTDDDQLAEDARLELAGAPVTSDPWALVRSTLVRWALSTRTGFALGPFWPFLLLNQVARSRLDALFEEPPAPFHSARGVARLSDVQGAVGRAQLSRLDAMNAVRRANAERLLELLSGVPGLELPRVVDGCTPTFNAVAVRVADARAVRVQLLNRGIDTREDYMRWYGTNSLRRDEVLYLPNHPGLTPADLEYVAHTLRQVLEAR